MTERTLLVPGATAATLEDEGGVEVWNAVKAGIGMSNKELGGRPPEEWVPLLSMAHTPGSLAPAATSLEPGTTIRATGVVRTPYARLIASGVEPFPYDWRGDIRYSAQLLLDYLRTHQPAGARWNLIGHSEGNFVIVAASKLAPSPDDFSRLVGRVILVASDIAGTMAAANALLFGSADLGPENQPRALALARTWPGFYQMLPSWPAVVDPLGHPLPISRQLTAPRGWPSTDAIPGDLLLRARQLQALLHGPFAHMGPGVASLVILGHQQMTPVTVVRDADSFVQDRETFEIGDTQVAYNRTLAWGGTPFASHVLTLEGAREHAWLCEDEEALDAIRRWLKRAAPPPPPLVA